jgi:ubiquinone/menaquinone biosynthesis C-methylase UbiE
MRMTSFEKRFVNDPVHADRVAQHAKQLLARIPVEADWTYLDIGCGIGSAARAIAASNPIRVTGIDVDPNQITAAVNAGALPNLDLLVMDATRLRFPDSHFQIVATRNATHHIPDWERVVREMSRVLRPGGYLIYTDFVVPAWASATLRVLRPPDGLPSEPRLAAISRGQGLVWIYRNRTVSRLDVIAQKDIPQAERLPSESPR